MLSFRFILLLYFLSGFSALTYQIAWQRMLGFFVGTETISVILISSAYMLGMGFGNLAGGAVADRQIKQQTLLIAFAIAELSIAVFAISSKFLIYDVMYKHFPSCTGEPAVVFLILFCVLLFPTFFMGFTLPVVSKAFVEKIGQAQDRISSIYAANTFGAALGAAFTSTVAIRNLGYEGALSLGALISLACGLAVFNISRTSKEYSKISTSDLSEQFDHGESPQDKSRLSSGAYLTIWMTICLLSGFTALGLEMIWFRVLHVMMKANSMTYGWLLFIYLTGLALGTAVGARLAERCEKPAAAFFLCQSVIGLYAVISLTALLKDLGPESTFPGLYSFLGRYNPIYFDSEKVAPLELIGLFVLLPGYLILPPTILMGTSFSLLQRIVHCDLARLGTRLGALQAANITGSTCGALVIGFFSLQTFGTAGTLRYFLIYGCLFLLVYLIARIRHQNCAPLKVALILACPLLSSWILWNTMLSAEQLWSRLHGCSSHDGFIVKEDVTGVSALKSVDNKALEHMHVYINGQGHSELPFGLFQSQIGTLPIFMHPNPVDIAIIGFGSGDTLYAAGAHKNTKNLTCFEIVKPAVDCLQEWHRQKPYPPVEGMFKDRRIRIVFGDGRKAIQRERKLYDVIQGDPLRPFDSGAGNLNSTEYFQMLRKHLKPGGIVVAWAPTTRSLNTFLCSFPYTVVFGSTVIGSEEPIIVDKDKILQSFNRNRIAGYLEKTGTDQEALLKQILDQYQPDARSASALRTDLNTDLFPRDEFLVP